MTGSSQVGRASSWLMPYLGSRSRYQSRCDDANRSSSQFGIDRLPRPVLVRFQHGVGDVLGQSAVVEAGDGGAVFDDGRRELIYQIVAEDRARHAFAGVARR